MDEFSVWLMVDRLKVELAGRGLSLRKVDKLLPKGQSKRHKFQRSRGRPIPIGDIFEILKVAKIDPATFLSQLAGFGHPLEVAAIRGQTAPKWTDRQRKILANVELLTDRGSKGFEEAKAELRQLELMRDESPLEADDSAWAWLAEEKRPGVIVGLLSFLALAAPRSNAHRLLQIGVHVLATQLRSDAGGKFATASGRCFIQVGLVNEGFTILENFALSIAGLYGDNDDQAVVLFHLAKAAAMLGDYEVNAAALRKISSIGSEHLRFSAGQLIAFQELNVGDVRLAARMYDELVEQAQYWREPTRSRMTVSCSRLSAHHLAGDLSLKSVLELSGMIKGAKDVLPPRVHVGFVIDLAVFFEAVGKAADARRTLEEELWTAIDLEDPEIQLTFAELWERLGLPKDTRFQTLLERATSGEPSIPVRPILRK